MDAKTKEEIKEMILANIPPVRIIHRYGLNAKVLRGIRNEVHGKRGNVEYPIGQQDGISLKCDNSINNMQMVSSVINSLSKGDRVELTKMVRRDKEGLGFEIHSTTIEKITSTLVFAKVNGWMEAFNTGDLASGEIRIRKVEG